VTFFAAKQITGDSMGKHKPLATKRPVVRFEMGTPTKEGRRINFGNLWDYAPAPESIDHVTIQKRYDLLIDGKFVGLRGVGGLGQECQV
jgi:hypothetical protein